MLCNRLPMGESKLSTSDLGTWCRVQHFQNRLFNGFTQFVFETGGLEEDEKELGHYSLSYMHGYLGLFIEPAELVDVGSFLALVFCTGSDRLPALYGEQGHFAVCWSAFGRNWAGSLSFGAFLFSIGIQTRYYQFFWIGCAVLGSMGS